MSMQARTAITTRRGSHSQGIVTWTMAPVRQPTTDQAIRLTAEVTDCPIVVPRTTTRATTDQAAGSLGMARTKTIDAVMSTPTPKRVADRPQAGQLGVIPSLWHRRARGADETAD